MCINGVIASGPQGRLEVPCGTEPILQYLWVGVPFPTRILPLSSIQAASGLGTAALKHSLGATPLAYSVRCCDL